MHVAPAILALRQYEFQVEAERRVLSLSLDEAAAQGYAHVVELRLARLPPHQRLLKLAPLRDACLNGHSGVVRVFARLAHSAPGEACVALHAADDLTRLAYQRVPALSVLCGVQIARTGAHLYLEAMREQRVELPPEIHALIFSNRQCCQ